jgi:hypothetical protein
MRARPEEIVGDEKDFSRNEQAAQARHSPIVTRGPFLVAQGPVFFRPCVFLLDNRETSKRALHYD